MAILYKTDGSVTPVSPKEGKYFSLKELQGYVGGYIQIVPLPNGEELVINEEGKLDGLPTNQLATSIWKKAYPISKYPENNDELVVGNALVISEGETEK